MTNNAHHMCTLVNVSNLGFGKRPLAFVDAADDRQRDESLPLRVWQLRYLRLSRRPVALRPCLSAGLPFSVQLPYTSKPTVGKGLYP